MHPVNCAVKIFDININANFPFVFQKQLHLSFKFPYYGHYLDRVLLTMGGNVKFWGYVFHQK